MSIFHIRTVAQIRREKNIPLNIRKDSVYKPIVRTERVFPKLHISAKLQEVWFWLMFMYAYMNVCMHSYVQLYYFKKEYICIYINLSHIYIYIVTSIRCEAEEPNCAEPQSIHGETRRCPGATRAQAARRSADAVHHT